MNVFKKYKSDVRSGGEARAPKECEKGIDLFIAKDFPQCELNAAISTLVSHSEDLKMMGCAKLISVEKLIQLLNIMESHTQSEAVLLKRKGESVWLGPSFESINRSADACLVSLCIMTSSDMPQRIFMENFISKTLLFVKFQLQNTIYPDLSFAIDKKQKNLEQTTNMNRLLEKLVRLIKMLSELLNNQILTEPLLAQISSICVSSLYVENATSIQLECLKLSAILFKNHESFRTRLLLDISTSIKTDVDPKCLYVLNDERNIQMVTALVLQLVQCSALPNKAIAQKVKLPKLIFDSYEQVSSIFHAFLYLMFKNGHQSKLFQTFVEDILYTINLPAWPGGVLFLNLLGTILIKNMNINETDTSLKVSSLNYICKIAIYLKQNCTKEVNFTELVDDIKGRVRRRVGLEGDVLLRQVLLDFLAVSGQSDETREFARRFCIARWYATNRLSEPTKKPSSREELYKLLQTNIKVFNKTLCSTNDGDVYEAYVDFNCAKLIATYLNSYDTNQIVLRFSSAIFCGLQDASIQVRGKALKCLTTIIQADPSVLNESRIQSYIKSSLLDSSISLRETTLELISKVILTHLELVDKYYDVFSTRILDTAVSVRKKVIKILGTICLKYPHYPKISDIYVKLIRRINDEESVKKLVVDLFLEVWFTPTKEGLMLQKVAIITGVLDTFKEVDFTSFKILLGEMLKLKGTKLKELLVAFEQIVSVLVDNLLTVTGSRVTNINVLHIIVKVNPEVALKHLNTICKYFSYLTENCKNRDDVQTIATVVKIMKRILPLIGRAKQNFLYEFEGNLLKLVHQHDSAIIQSSLSCLSLLTNDFTHNYTLINACFVKYWIYLTQTKIEDLDKLLLRRSICVLGFLLRYFDLGDDSKSKVVALFLDFLHNDSDLQMNTLKALGSISVRYSDIMLKHELKQFYCQTLTSPNSPTSIKSQVLINIESFLRKQDKQATKKSLDYKRESLKEMKDVESGMNSSIIQQFLKEILASYLNPKIEIRQPALKIIQSVLQQGLVQPSQIIPYLICMSTDYDEGISNIANNYLSELEMKYPGCVYSRSSLGIKLSYELQTILNPNEIVRGSKISNNKQFPSSVNASLFNVLKNSKHKLGLILNMLKQFEEQVRCSLPLLLYLADNLAYFPYTTVNEIMFLISQLDSVISLSGANILQSFQEGLSSVEGDEKLNETDGNDDATYLIAKLPENLEDLYECLDAANNCLLLLLLKQHLKNNYGLNDTQIRQYNTTQTKILHKTISCKKKTLFKPDEIVNKLNKAPKLRSGEDEKAGLVRRYLEFKKMMFDLDELESKNESEDSINKSRRKTPKRAPKRKSSVKRRRKRKYAKLDSSCSSSDSDESFVL